MAQGTRRAQWHPVPPEMAVPAGQLLSSSSAQVNVLQLLLHALPPGVAVTGAPGLHMDNLDASLWDSAHSQPSAPIALVWGHHLPTPEAASGLICPCHGLCLQSSGWEEALSVGSSHAQPGMTGWDVSSCSRVSTMRGISAVLQ